MLTGFRNEFENQELKVWHLTQVLQAFFSCWELSDLIKNSGKIQDIDKKNPFDSIEVFKGVLSIYL